MQEYHRPIGVRLEASEVQEIFSQDFVFHFHLRRADLAFYLLNQNSEADYFLRYIVQADKQYGYLEPHACKAEVWIIGNNEINMAE